MNPYGPGNGQMAIGIGRRKFIAALGGTAVAWPLTARAQQATMPVIGILSGGPSDSFTPLEGSFRKGLAEAGFVDGKISPFEYRSAQGQFDRLPGLAVDLVSRGPAMSPPLRCRRHRQRKRQPAQFQLCSSSARTRSKPA